jgi:hypothetical protein
MGRLDTSLILTEEVRNGKVNGAGKGKRAVVVSAAHGQRDE